MNRRRFIRTAFAAVGVVFTGRLMPSDPDPVAIEMDGKRVGELVMKHAGLRPIERDRVELVVSRLQYPWGSPLAIAFMGEGLMGLLR